jgi:hypothetical protein
MNNCLEMIFFKPKNINVSLVKVQCNLEYIFKLITYQDKKINKNKTLSY